MNKERFDGAPIQNIIEKKDSGDIRTELVLYANPRRLKDAKYYVNTFSIKTGQGGGTGFDNYEDALKHFNTITETPKEPYIEVTESVMDKKEWERTNRGKKYTVRPPKKEEDQ